jgi:hypothetical protein
MYWMVVSRHKPSSQVGFASVRHFINLTPGMEFTEAVKFFKAGVALDDVSGFQDACGAGELSAR